jgi:uncharacterized protein YjbJ (UPF0337 family)
MGRRRTWRVFEGRGIRQKAEGRRQKAEGRRQKAEGRRQKANAEVLTFVSENKSGHPN